MVRRPCTFKQGDVTRAVRAVIAAGQHVSRVEVDKEGRIVITTTDDAANSNHNETSKPRNEWDDVK